MSDDIRRYYLACAYAARRAGLFELAQQFDELALGGWTMRGLFDVREARPGRLPDYVIDALAIAAWGPKL